MDVSSSNEATRREGDITLRVGNTGYMPKKQHSRWGFVVGLAVLLFLVGACADSDDASDDVSANVVPAGGDDSSGGDSGGDDSNGDDSGVDDTTSTTGPGGSGADSGGSSGLASVWPLPPGQATVLFAYTETDDGVVSRQAATFELTGVDVETAISFYEDYFAGTDYVVGDRIPLGESIALNISMADNPNINAVVQAGVQADGKLTINQERSEFIEAADTSGGDDSATSSGSDGSAASDDGSGEGAGADDAGSVEALVFDGTTATINWAGVSAVYLPNTGPADDPFFQIHTDNALDGFYLSFEFFLVWGEAWTGETGTFEISCSDPTTDTGICVHFDPDGDGPLGNVGADFAAAGSVTINQLDDAGYSIMVTGLTFSDGTVVEDFELLG